VSVTRPEIGTVRRLPVLRMLAVTPLVALAMGAAVMGARSRTPDNQIVAGVHVGDLDLGGKSTDEARPLLEQWSARKAAAPLTLRLTADAGLTHTWQPDAAKLGLGVDVPGTLDAAAKAGREDVAGQIGHMFSGPRVIQVQAAATVDDAKLRAYLRRQIAADVNRKPKNATFVLLKGGGFGTRREQPGRTVNIEASATAIKQAWSSYLAAAAPTTGQARAAATGDRTDAAAPPATGDKAGAASTPPAAGDKTGATATPPGNGDRTTPGADAAQPAQDAATTGQPASTAGPEATLAVSLTPAAITDADVSQIDSVLGAKTSYVNGTTSRLGNIRIAARHINGTLLKPGDVFSYNKIVGPRDEDEGYREAPILVQGRHDTGIAGGICQTSGTLFNAVLASGLKIVERSNHSTPIGYLPVGLDATVSYGSLDLKFRNDTTAPVYVAATLNGRSLTFSIFGKKVPGRKVSLVRGSYSRYGAGFTIQHDRSKPAGYRRVVERAGSGGHVTWYRIIKEDGKVVHRDVISSNYSSHPGVMVVGTGAPRTKKRPAASGAAAPARTDGAAPPADPAGAPQL